MQQPAPPPAPQPKPFGRTVRERRRALDLTQEELARRVGCAAVTLRKIEAGDLRPSEQIAERLANALAVPLDEREGFVRAARGVDQPAPPEPAPPPPPVSVGGEDLGGREVRGYRLGARIGLGGFGAVYRAVQPVVEREVAVKVILPQYADHPLFIRRFEAEAQTIARLEHPHIVPLYDYWREPGAAFLVMRLLRGGSLQERLREGPVAPADALAMVAQLCDALDAAHRAGIVHRDLKPANVLLDEGRNVYLADFGIAKDTAHRPDLTFAGAYVGSPAYSSPEQLRVEPVTPRTDIYALGILLFELLTGTPPFPGPSTALLIDQHLNARVPLLRERGPTLPQELDHIIQRAMAKVPAARYPDAAAMLADLRRAQGAAASVVYPAPTTAPSAYATEVLELGEADNPYKGLRAFAEQDAADFFGREALVLTLLERLGEPSDLARFLAVVGPSGIGKSSLVRAGLLPALRRGALPGSDQWFIVDMLPGESPRLELARALLRVAPAGVALDELLDLLGTDSRGLLRAVRRVLPADPAVELLLVVDQFEELFTLSAEAERRQLLDQIVTAMLEERSRLRIVATVRADFLAATLAWVDFAELIRQRSELVLPLTPDELEQAVVQPARRVGLTLEPGLVATIVAEVSGRPGALPLLQHALSELYAHRAGRVLTEEAYGQIGGVTGALAASAEACYAGLSLAEQATARQLLLRLVTLGEGAEDTRRRVRQAELEGLAPPAEVRGALAAFGRARLLSFDRDARTHQPSVEVAHEALLRAWPRLRAWLAESREAVAVQRRLAHAAGEWRAAGDDPSFLAGGARLVQFSALAADAQVALDHDERAYLDASRAAAERMDEEERQRQARELEQSRAAERAQRRSAGRLRLLAGILAASLALAVGLGALALSRQQSAQASARRADALRLAADAQRLFAEGGPSDVGALLTLRSLRLGSTPQGDLALGAAGALQYPTRIIADHDDVLIDGLFTPDGRTLVTADIAGTQIFWDAASGAELRRFTDPHGGGAMTLSPDGRMLFVGSRTDGTITGYDLATLQPRVTAHSSHGRVLSLDVSADGRLLVSTGVDARVQLWDATSGALLRSWPIPNISTDRAARFLPDGRAVLWVDGDQLVLQPVDQDEPAWREGGSGIGFSALDVSRDGRTAIASDSNGVGHVFDLGERREVRQLRGHGQNISGVAISPDGATAATVSEDLSLRLWDLTTGAELRRYLGHTGNLFRVYYSPDGQTLVSVSFDRTVRLWSVQGNAPAALLDAGGPVSSVAISPDGRVIATGSIGGGVRLWDAAARRMLRTLNAAEASTLSFAPDGQTLLANLADRTTRLWRVADGAEVWKLPSAPAAPGDFGFAPDGQTALVVQSDRIDIVRASDGATLVSIPHVDDVLDTAFSPDGARLALANGNERVATVWDTRSGAKVQTIHASGSEGLYSVAISPDGQTLATGGTDNVIRLWSIATGAQTGELRGHSDIPWDLAFSRDGTWLASAGLDNTARIWELSSGRELRRFRHQSRIYSMALAPGDHALLTGSADGTARLWEVDRAPTVAALCGHLQRDLTDEERSLYEIPDATPTCP